VRKKLLLGLGVPFAAAVVTFIWVFGLSRILLALGEEGGAVPFALALALLILIVGGYFGLKASRAPARTTYRRRR
jgi:hypothetical protein